MERPSILDYDTANCSIGAAVRIIGERQTFLVLREAFNGVRRFDDMQRRTAIPRQVLSDRLARLVEEGLLRKVPYRDSGQRRRDEYRLTDKGLDLYPVLMALRTWGDRYMAPDGPFVVYRHHDCRGVAEIQHVCSECGQALSARDVTPEAGPGTAAAVYRAQG
jgi:DNA-binding HxlR family transcriptional regulator